jgi:CheY-like chemotaxis protein
MPSRGREIERKPARLLDMKTTPHAHTGSEHGPRGRQGRRASAARARPALVSPWDPRSELLAGGGEPPAQRAQTDGALALLDQPAAKPRRKAARYRILVVEDDARVAGVIRESLELEGEADWAVQTASMGTLALELANATPPDVVLLDVRLPDLDGAEVYRRLRATKRTQGARILFLSAGTSFDLYQRGIEDGVLLRKPFDVGELAPLVRALLAG